MNGQKSKSHGSEWSGLNRLPIASQLDRLASFIFDVFVIILPVFSLLTFSLKNSWTKAILGQQEFLSIYFLIVLSFCFSIIFVFYQAVLLKIQSQTIGQKIFGIQVVSLFQRQSLSWRNAFSRALFLNINLFICGWFSFSIFREKWRRTYYDKASDTVVIYTPQSQKKASYPNEAEASFARGVQFGVLFYFLLIIYVPLKMFNETNSPQGSLTCQKKYFESSMDEVLALYFANDLEGQCLKEVAQHKLETDKESRPLSYLALSMSYAETNIGLSNKYLHEVCRSDLTGRVCYLSQFISSWNGGESIGAIRQRVEQLAQIPLLTAYVWSVRTLVKIGDWKGVKTVIEELEKKASFDYFVNFHRAKAYWGQGQRRVSLDLYKSLYVGVENEDRKYEISKDYCYFTSLSHCDSLNGNICQQYLTQAKSYTTTPQKQAILFNKSQCEKVPVMTYSEHFSDKQVAIEQLVLLEEYFSNVKLNLPQILDLSEQYFGESLMRLVYHRLSQENMQGEEKQIWFQHWVRLSPYLRKKMELYSDSFLPEEYSESLVITKQKRKIKDLKLRIPASAKGEK